MKKLAIILSSTLVAVGAALPAVAIEGGELAKDHPRIVVIYIQGDFLYSSCSGFLFAPRIVITAAHCQVKIGERFDRWPDKKVLIGSPGKVLDLDSKKHRVVKVFSDSRYFKPYTNLFDQKDVAVIVTDKPVANVSWAKAITKSEMQKLIDSEAYATIGGYGYSSAKERNIAMNKYKLPRVMQAKFATYQEYLNVDSIRPDKDFFGPLPKFNAVPWLHTTKKLGATCDGDSGAGIFIEKGGEFIFLGVNGMPIESPNCGRAADWKKYGGLTTIRPIYDYMHLLKLAINYLNEFKSQK